jgi:uncharacterized protein (TIGR02466 family)
MSIREIFGVHIGQYQNNDINNEALVKDLNNLGFINHNSPGTNPNRQTNHYLHTDTTFSTLTKWFEQCLEEYRSYQGWDCDQLEITIMWGNKSAAGQGTHHDMHQHQSCLVSGVYYPTEGSDLYFRDPIQQRLYNAFGVRSVYPCYNVCVTPKPGKLLLFPSWLDHGTQPHTGWKDRWSIAFNAVPTGSINSNCNASGNPSIILRHELPKQ